MDNSVIREREMRFRTKGTVQLVLTANSGAMFLRPSLKVSISPARTHTVMVDKDEFIVFVETPRLPKNGSSRSSGPVNALVWHKNTEFEVPHKLRPELREAAARSISVEIDISDAGNAKICGVIFPSSDK